MAENLRIFGTRLLVQEIPKEKSNEMQKSAGGLYIPQTTTPQDRLYRGVVVGIGDEVSKIFVGDTIIYDKMGPAPFKVGDIVYEMVDQSAVIGAYS